MKVDDPRDSDLSKIPARIIGCKRRQQEAISKAHEDPKTHHRWMEIAAFWEARIYHLETLLKNKN